MTESLSNETALDRLHPFTFRGKEDGKYEVRVDGRDVATSLSGVRFEAVAGGEPPLVILQLSPQKALDPVIDTLARVVVEDVQSDPGPAAAVFLAAIDPEKLEEAALNRLDLTGEPGALTAAMLRQLQEWANGRT